MTSGISGWIPKRRELRSSKTQKHNIESQDVETYARILRKQRSKIFDHCVEPNVEKARSFLMIFFLVNEEKMSQFSITIMMHSSPCRRGYKGGLCPPNPPRLAAGYSPRCSLLVANLRLRWGIPPHPPISIVKCYDALSELTTDSMLL